jgi:hypothetical protein
LRLERKKCWRNFIGIENEMIFDVRNKINCVWNVSSFIAESKCTGRKIENVEMVNIVNESMDSSVRMESPSAGVAGGPSGPFQPASVLSALP